jgi:hypothetical protein
VTPPIPILHNTHPLKRPAPPPPVLLVTNSRKPHIAHLRIAIQRLTRMQRRRVVTRVGALSPPLRLSRRCNRALSIVRGIEVRARRGRLLRLGLLLLRHTRQRVQGRQRVLRTVDGRERRTSAHCAEERVRVAAGVRGAVCAGQRGDAVRGVRDSQVRGPVVAWGGCAGCARVASDAVFRRGVWVCRGRCALPVTALAAERLVCGCWRDAGAAFRVVEAVVLVFLELVEEEGALEAHLLDAPVQALDALSCAVVVLLDVVDAPAQFDAFAVVGGFD